MFEVREQPAGIVRLTFGAPFSKADEAAYLAALDRLAQRSTAYVVLASMDGRSPLSAEGRKRQALWFKASRDRLAACCRGLVRLRRGDAHAGLGNEAFREALPFPLFETDEPGEAERLADQLLAAGPGAADERG